jgi:hypothetical protein
MTTDEANDLLDNQITEIQALSEAKEETAQRIELVSDEMTRTAKEVCPPSLLDGQY